MYFIELADEQYIVAIIHMLIIRNYIYLCRASSLYNTNNEDAHIKRCEVIGASHLRLCCVHLICGSDAVTGYSAGLCPRQLLCLFSIKKY